jgi:predicted urease superfamily metal-dependent hydrolase
MTRKLTLKELHKIEEFAHEVGFETESIDNHHGNELKISQNETTYMSVWFEKEIISYLM